MSRFPNVSLSVIIPAYNEQTLIVPAIRACVQTLAETVGDFEVVLIDDCSTDATPALADALARELPPVRVIHNSRNLRQGGCVQLGFTVARCDLVTHNAVDYPFDYRDLPMVLEHFPAADVVVVARRSYPGVSSARRLLSWSNRTLIRLLFGLRITDYNFVQVYKRSLLMQQQCFSEATAFVTVERIIRAHHGGARVVEVEADYRPRAAGVSSSGSVQIIRDSLRDMAKLWAELRAQRLSRATGRRCEGDTP